MLWLGNQPKFFKEILKYLFTNPYFSGIIDLSNKTDDQDGGTNMNELTLKGFYEHEIEYSNRMLGYYERNLERVKNQLKRERKEDRELVEHVWNRGVVTKLEMEIYTKEFKGTETEKLEKEARQTRKAIRKYKSRISEYEAKLA